MQTGWKWTELRKALLKRKESGYTENVCPDSFVILPQKNYPQFYRQKRWVMNKIQIALPVFVMYSVITPIHGASEFRTRSTAFIQSIDSM